MVHRQQPHVFLVGQPQHGGTHERAFGQVERSLSLRGDQSPDFTFPLPGGSLRRSTTGSPIVRLGAISCVGRPSTFAKVVRNDS